MEMTKEIFVMNAINMWLVSHAYKTNSNKIFDIIIIDPTDEAFDNIYYIINSNARQLNVKYSFLV